MAEDIKVPDIGEYSNVDVIEIMVQPGDTVAAEDSLIALETDKATMEIPAPKAGVVKALAIKEGDKVSEGDVILSLEAEGSSAEAAPAETAAPAEASSPAPASGSAEPQAVNVPDIGEYSGVDVIEVLIKPGDELQEEASMVTLETDKATMDIPAPFAGTVAEVKLQEGDKVSQGDLIAMVTPAGAASAAAPEPVAEKPVSAAAAPVAEKSAPAAAPQSAPAVTGGKAHASPAMRRLARELGVSDLTTVPATGRKGRITEEDLKQFVKGIVQSAQNGGGAGLGLLPDPVVDFAKFGDIDTQPLPRIKKISGDNLARNWVRVPHITFFEDADITELEAFRKGKKAAAEKAGVKLTPVPFIVKAVAKALSEFPNVNSSLSADGASQVFKQYVHVGVAVDTPKGLMVPVIRDADQKGIYDIARDLMEYSTQAREGKLKPESMQGGCFTISSLGGIGTKYFAPIVNMPEAAILGVSKADMKPIYDGNGGFTPRLMLPLSLSADHRVIDGAEAGKFIVTVAQYLSDIKELVL